MRQHGYDIINYIDDFVRVGAHSVARASYDALLALLRHLGLDVAPTATAMCLGDKIGTIQTQYIRKI